MSVSELKQIAQKPLRATYLMCMRVWQQQERAHDDDLIIVWYMRLGAALKML